MDGMNIKKFIEWMKVKMSISSTKMMTMHHDVIDKSNITAVRWFAIDARFCVHGGQILELLFVKSG